ncbi:phenol degradation protein meta [Pseudomonas sp. RW407]|uniref:SphA family protein n=1 Tax=Pseudomonas sp. RW407 TaxID=2202894 RepID=UPI000D6EF2D5|nr:transporter [Pseudomonas sp. RW407]PWU31658.1 phenol degradation protein meta [Pseudomonas sp. RW407]
MNRGGRKLLAGCLLLAASQAQAAENGVGFYLLGSRGPMAGALPPPGLYLQNDLYRYAGSAGAAKDFPVGGRVMAGIQLETRLAMPTLLWSTPWQLAGGNLGLSWSQPLGGPALDVDAELTGPHGQRLGTDVHASNYTYGDPVLAAMLGWHRGNFHWQGGVALNVPAGDYDEDALANIAFHRWGADPFAALTWFDPTIGLDLSVAAGVTFNAANPATDYRSGNEAHLEWSAEQHFGPRFSAGLLGYHYRQVSDDSGRGASLGPFRGRTRALGATLAWNFPGARPWSLRLKAFKEQAAYNRLEGHSVFLSLSVPLSSL